MSKGKILVAGGGISGLTAAERLGRAGVGVVLVEKSAGPGGRVANLHRYYPRLCPPRCGLEILLSNIRGLPNVEMFLLTEMTGVQKKSPGAYTVTLRDLKQEAGEYEIEVDGIILATGADLYDASRMGEFGHGNLPGVITSMELESLFRPDGPTGGRPVHPVTGKPLNRVAFIQCAGSRDKNHLSYCSGYCCTVTLKQIEYLHQWDRDIGTWVFYRDIRTPGSKEEYFRHVREEYRPVLIRGTPSSVECNGEGLIVRADDTLSGKKVEGDFDLVVLATGMVPPVLPDIEGLEKDRYGFFPGHTPCDPTEIRRSGIWAAGCAQQPMDVEDSVRSALSAVAQCLVKIHQQPSSYPEVNKKKCDHCGRCVKECPYGACVLGPDGYPAVHPGDCRGCGICQGGCPLMCINLPGQGIKKIEDVVDKVLSGDVPEPSVLLFLCSNDAYPAWQKLVRQGEVKGLEGVVPISVPCIGSVNMAWLNEALIGGLDGVMLAGCRPDQCHHGAGTSLAETRMQNLKETLGRMRIEPERIYLTGVTIDDTQRLLNEIQKFSDLLVTLGPSPFK
ncbi:MAG: hydrogenase iron-sulfur subunit [Bacillota bacterium]